MKICDDSNELPPMSLRTRRHCTGFTLIEMVGVLAVIAILASLLIPKIFESINNARLAHAQLSYQTVKTAVMEHFAKFYSLNSSNGVAFTENRNDFDAILVGEGLLDKPFVLKIGGTATIRIRNVAGYDANTPRDPGLEPGAWGYDLSGNGRNDIVGAQYLVEAVLFGVSVADAQALNDRFDGPDLAEDGSSGKDSKGRVVYDHIPPGQQSNGNANGLTVFIYITHR